MILLTKFNLGYLKILNNCNCLQALFHLLSLKTASSLNKYFWKLKDSSLKCDNNANNDYDSN